MVIASILLLGQLGLARTRVADAAEAAAEAATSALANAGVTCAPTSLQLDLADFVPGGRVRASVACTVAIARETVPGMPGHLTLQASALAPVDPYRNSP